MPSCKPQVSIRTFDRALYGLKSVGFHGDGYSVSMEWYKSYVEPINYDLVYNIYWSNLKSDVFTEGVKFVVPGDQLQATFINLFKAGETYNFAVRAAAHEPGTLDFDSLPESPENGKMYPQAALREDITATDLIIPLDDVSMFPPMGIVLIGAEPISYSAIDIVDNNLVLFSQDQRGLYGYDARLHTTDGYDGYHQFDDPFVNLWKGFEDENGVTGVDTNKFEHQYPRTNADGYRGQQDIITGSKNLDVVDDINDGFPSWDHAGWDRNPVTDYLAGRCIGTYFGGEFGCADGYDSTGPERGLSIGDHINMREEYLLEITGEPVTLVRRMWEGKNSKHYSPTRENTAYRGLDNHGTGFVSGYDQYFNTRRSDGKILVRFGPTKEDFKREDSGIENEFIPNCWTLVTPSVQDGDFIIRYNDDGSEEWRYEIIDVDRNRTFSEIAGGSNGAQKFTAVRVRKTDPIYQWRAIRDTSMFPSEVLTHFGSVSGPGGIPLHMHRIVINENIVSLQQINQTTSIERGHNHVVENGVVLPALGHTHTLIL